VRRSRAARLKTTHCTQAAVDRLTVSRVSRQFDNVAFVLWFRGSFVLGRCSHFNCKYISTICTIIYVSQVCLFHRYSGDLSHIVFFCFTYITSISTWTWFYCCYWECIVGGIFILVSKVCILLYCVALCICFRWVVKFHSWLLEIAWNAWLLFTYKMLRTLSMAFLIWLLFSVTIYGNITLQFDVCDCYGD